MKNIYNINDIKNDNESGAMILRVVRPGSDDYDKIHNKDNANKVPEYFEKVCNDILESDDNLDKFMSLYINKINEHIVSGKNISNIEYKIYNFFRTIKN